MSSHTILNIPPEIFENIAELLDLAGFKALRLVCKEAATSSLRPFAKDYFTERAFLLSSEDSLRTLLKIAEHETLGRSMINVILCIDEPPSDDIVDGLRFFEEARIIEESSPEELLRLKEYRLESRRVTTDQRKRMQEESLDFSLLKAAFTSFAHFGNNVGITIYDRCNAFESCTPARLSETLEQLCGDYMWEKGDEQRASKIVLEAIVQSGLALERFSIGMSEWCWSTRALTYDANVLSHTYQIFKNLKVLELQLDMEDDATVEDAEKIIRLVVSAQNLETLVLKIRRPSQGDIDRWPDAVLRQFPMELFWSSEFPALKVLDLQGFVVTFKDFVGLLKRHKKLEWFHFHISFLQCRMQSDNQCHPVIGQQSDNEEEENSEKDKKGADDESAEVDELNELHQKCIALCTIRDKQAGIKNDEPPWLWRDRALTIPACAMREWVEKGMPLG